LAREQRRAATMKHKMGEKKDKGKVGMTKKAKVAPKKSSGEKRMMFVRARTANVPYGKAMGEKSKRKSMRR